MYLSLKAFEFTHHQVMHSGTLTCQMFKTNGNSDQNYKVHPDLLNISGMAGLSIRDSQGDSVDKLLKSNQININIDYLVPTQADKAWHLVTKFIASHS